MMKTLNLVPGVSLLLRILLGTAALLVSLATNAHTIQICWKDVGTVTTFYAGSYHSPAEGPSPVGQIIIDGFGYPFSGWIPPANLPADAHCWSAPSYSGAPSGNPDGVPNPGVVHFQTFTSAFPAGLHTLSFDNTTAIQSPWEAFLPQSFGGGTCADADFDGLCNDVDACPLDAANDGDGDGICGNVDNCPLNANQNQADVNNNGQGDACEGIVCGNGIVQGAEQCDDGNIAGGDGCSAICTIELEDTPPVANAGSDQNVSEGLLVMLDGSLSNDSDPGDVLTYAWEQVGGTVVTLAGANTSQPSFTAPTVAPGGGTLSFKLTVTSNGKSSTDTVSITISNINHTPVADAGANLSITEGSPVGLDGTGSFDIDSDAFTYEWEQVSGPVVSLSDTNSATPSFIAPIVGTNGAPGVVATLVFKLTVADGLPPDAPSAGYTLADTEDTVTIEITNVNNPPTADAGSDITLNENSAVALSGNASTDPDNDSLSFSWQQIGGPVVPIADANSATPSLTMPFTGPGGTDLTFELTVSDGNGGSATDQVIVHVQNANDPPLASAAQPSIDCIWPPNHGLVAVGINGVSDPDDNATITIDSVTQDEPTNGLGDGDTAVDAVINADGTVLLRAERSGKGDGRVYHIHFTASDQEGATSGVVNVCVQHNKKSIATDNGELFNSTQ